MERYDDLKNYLLALYPEMARRVGLVRPVVSEKRAAEGRSSESSLPLRTAFEAA